MIHAIAAVAKHHGDFLRRLQQLPRDSLVAPYALPTAPFRAVFDAMYHHREVVSPPVADPTERALID